MKRMIIALDLCCLCFLFFFVFVFKILRAGNGGRDPLRRRPRADGAGGRAGGGVARCGAGLASAEL